MFKKTITALSMLCLLAACQSDDTSSSSHPKPRKDISLTRAEQEMADLGTNFAFRFFHQACKTEVARPNLFISPLSASLCLSMISNGAAGHTLSEMTDVLGFPDYSLEEMNSYHKKLVSALVDLDNTTQLGIANSIWIKQGFGVHDDFVNVNKKMYDAQVRELDFSSPKAPGIINNWCAEKTNNCIPEVLKEIPESARLYLLNALYFKGIWKNQFKKSDTKAEPFTNVDGSHSTVQMMKLSGERFDYTENEYFSIAELPYGNEAFSMVVLLPSEEASLDECLPQLTEEHWREWNDDLSRATLDVKLPRFELKYDKELIGDMMAMGMREAFTPAADFSGVSDEDLFISLLQQFTYVKVNEEGTEAAAVTVGGMDLAAPGPSTVIPFYVDRPFAFLIKEKSTGTILFMGKVAEL